MNSTKEMFASMDDTVRKLRRTDPIQFDVLYWEWRRLREIKSRRSAYVTERLKHN